MSLPTISNYITCLTKDESPESIFLRTISSSSTGKLYINTWGGNTASGGSLTTYSKTFTDADLVNVTIDGVVYRCLLVTHNFGTNLFDYFVKDNNGNGVIVAQSVIDVNSTYIIIDDTITGTWTYDSWTL